MVPAKNSFKRVWAKDIEETQGHAVNYPMIGDTDLVVAKLYNILPADEAGIFEEEMVPVTA